MLQNEDIICISWLVWDSVPLIMHQMMTRLAVCNRVLFVDPPVAMSNLAVKPSLWKHHLRKIRLWLRGTRQITDNLHVCYPPPLVMQYGHSQAIDRLNQAITAGAVARAAKRLGFNNPVLWIYHPYAVNPAGQFNEKLVCYDCNDDVGYFYCLHFDKRKKLDLMENSLTKKADIVFATSRYLYDLRKKHNPNTVYLPSAIDTRIFNAALSSSLEIAVELRDIPHPVIGFIGGMSNAKMNWDWVREAARTYGSCSFVFVGPCIDDPPDFILRQKNIMFTGTKSQSELPSYIKGFDVCIIPYKGKEFLQACQPTKAFEYLSAGKPVVAAWIPELEEIRNVVYMSRDTADFMSNMKTALEESGDPEIIRARIRVSVGYDWDDRVKEVSRLISNILA